MRTDVRAVSHRQAPLHLASEATRQITLRDRRGVKPKHNLVRLERLSKERFDGRVNVEESRRDGGQRYYNFGFARRTLVQARLAALR